MPHEIIINSPSGENLTDMNKLASAMDKRHEYKTKSTPPSLEFSVRKPTPKIIEPMDSLDQKDVKEEGSEKGETTVIVTAPGEVTVVTPAEEQTAEKVAVSAADGINTAPSKETGGEDKDKHMHKPTVEPAAGAPLHADIDRCSQSPERLLDSSTDSVPPSESSMESSQTYTSSLESSSHSPPLDESSLSSEKETSDGPLFISGPRVIEAPRAQRTPPTRRVQNFEVASESYAKNQPQLMKIRKIDSVHMHDRERSPVKKEGSGKHVGFVGLEPEPEDTNSYVCKIVGGVVQKIPVDTKKSPSHSPVQIRPKTGKGRKVNRRVSCKDLGQGDCQGWLFKRRSKGGSLLHSPWQRRWCVIKEYSLFYFHDNEAIKAEGVIHLPAFQVSPVDASEVKTKKFAFKIHNRGTSFCFASDRQEDMKKWMNKMGLAAISFHESRVDVRKRETSPSRYHDPDFSESDTDDTSAVSSREPSPARSTRGAAGSNQSSPQISRAERLRPASPDMRSSQEDLSVMMRRQSQRGQNIFGEDKNKQRRTAISRDMETLVTPEVIAYKKKKALERTLRAKVKELEELELALVAKEKLHTYQDLLNKLDSDAD